MDSLLLLIVAGLCAVSSHAERHYHFVYDKKNMTAAQSYCRENYTDLATFDNMEDVTTVVNMTDIPKLADSFLRAWIGLYDDRNSWKWSLADASFYEDGETEYRGWSCGQPNNEKGAERCSYTTGLGGWHDSRCEDTYPAVCLNVTKTNVTFVFINISMTWPQAQSYCRANYTDLASVRNEVENQQVRALIPAKQPAWIGLFRDGWKWSDGSSLLFTNWRDGDPRGSATCVATNVDGTWLNWRCDTKRAFICHSEPKTTKQATTKQATTKQATTKQATTKQVFRMKFTNNDPSFDPNDPAVAEGILKQLKQKLKGKGLNIKLSWKKQPDGNVFHKEEKKRKIRKDEL